MMHDSIFDGIVCVIPARGGSKEVPNKNMRYVGTLRLMERSIYHALFAGFLRKQIIVTSDSDEILDIAETYKVIAHHRPLEISTDTSSTEEAMLDILNNKQIGWDKMDSMLLLQPTSPIRFKGRIGDAVKTFKSGDFDSLVSVTPFYPLFWKQVHDSLLNKNSWSSFYPPQSRKRRQEWTQLDMEYFDNGNIYISKINMLKEKKCRVGDKPCIYSITELEGLQIDTEKELEYVSKIIESTNDISI